MLSNLQVFLFIAASAFPLVLFPILGLKWRKVGIVSLGIYIVSYLPFTLGGAYTVANHGGDHWVRE